MSKRVLLTSIVGLATVLGLFLGTAVAQKLHAPKQVWQAMIAGLNDINDINGSLMVFDMNRIVARATELAEREKSISEIESLPEAVKEGHAKVAQAARELAAAAQTGEEQDVISKTGDVIAACTACHYDLRDEERRQKLQ